jgi:hypothetical protein
VAVAANGGVNGIREAENDDSPKEDFSLLPSNE